MYCVFIWMKQANEQHSTVDYTTTMIIDLKNANDPIKWSLFPHFKILSVHAKEPTAKNCVLDPPGLTSALLSVLQARQPTSTSTKSTSTTINSTSTSTNDYSHKELLQKLQIRINTKSLNHPEGTNTTHTTPLWNQLCISNNTMENDDTPFNLFETTTTAATGKSFLLQIIITNNNDTGEDEFYTFCKTAFMVHHIFRLDQSTASKETILMVLTNIMESLTFGDALVIHYVGTCLVSTSTVGLLVIINNNYNYLWYDMPCHATHSYSLTLTLNTTIATIATIVTTHPYDR